ncbi:hypothetical protein CEXT_600511 [Caerostris extrusa]|uniref:Uncharacterized protein n=1 Tax=Caerostris extrusa TaxID=172846 RepID=A0AAV4WTK8_CAEEX|nr:hypothetical protein CEXT_600511 [Caerostris extrusa]
MDIRPAPSARLKNKFMPEEGILKNISEGSVSSPEPVNKISGGKNEHYAEATHAKSAESTKELHHKVVHIVKSPQVLVKHCQKHLGD